MASNSDDKGPPRGADTGGPKRPYATLDLKATEVASPDQPADPGAAASPGAEAPLDAKTDEASGPKPGPAAAGAEAGTEAVGGASEPISATAKAPSRNRSFITHGVAGAAGALVALVLWHAWDADSEATSQRATEITSLTRRVGEMESLVGARNDASGVRARLDEMTRTVKGMSDAQAKLASETRVLAARVGGPQDIPPVIADRLVKIEETLATLPAPAGSEPSPAARTLISRVDEELSALRTEAGRLAQRLDTLKGEVEERLSGAAKAADVAPLAAKLAAAERDVQTFVKSEADRNANASRIVLSLELGNLKRALDTGGRYGSELAAVRKVAGNSLDLAALERHADEGVQTLPELAKSFRRVANSMLDAEGDPPGASVVDRLMSGARSIVRVRKSGLPADDMSAEAVIGRMEGALKDGRLADVLAQAKALPPKAQLAGEDWVRKVEARHTIDQAIARIETALKTSLGEARAPGTGAQR